jgi:hypothetical protein
MRYIGEDGKVDWVGKTGVELILGKKAMVLNCENSSGEVFIAIATGSLVPSNWLGKRIKVTIELQEPDHG